MGITRGALAAGLCLGLAGAGARAATGAGIQAKPSGAEEPAGDAPGLDLGTARAEVRSDDAGAGGASPAAAIVARLSDSTLRGLVDDVLARNPRLAATTARARGAWQEPPQAKALPDPMVGITAYASPPETRVGPQVLTGTLSQRLPWFGKLGLRERAAIQKARALDARVEAQRLTLVTEARRLYYEIAFLDAWSRVVTEDHATLDHYEELARSRYASGGGIEQAVVKIQAELTKDEARQLEIANRRSALTAELNALRDQAPTTPIAPLVLSTFGPVTVEEGALRDRARALRPEMAEAEIEIARADAMEALARKEYDPDLTVGISYTRVGLRGDAAGIALPPPDNGKDVLAISASVNLPLHRGRLKAGVEEAAQRRAAAQEGKRDVTAQIDRALGELAERVTLAWRQLRLLTDVLAVQSDQSLRSAESGYAAGLLSSLDLLDAERVRLDVRTSIERSRADYAIAVARLEGAVGEPIGEMEGASR